MYKRFRCFEDYQVGQKGITNTRTVTEADVVNFACLTADYSRIHMDRHFAAGNVYGGRVAHGLLGSSLALGMLSLSTPHIVGRGVPGSYFHSLDVNYRGAIKLGDTPETHWQVVEKADDPSHQGFGTVKTVFQVINDEGSVVDDGTITIKVRKGSADNAELKLKSSQPWQVTEFAPDPERIYYIEDYPIGGGGETDGRTITETDIVSFAGFSGDYNPRHVDAEFAKGSIFGERVAHEMLVFNVAFGLWMRDFSRYPRPKTKIAGHINDKVSFLAPVKIGDTIHCRHKTLATRVSRSRPEAGVVTFGMQVINQRNEVVQEGSATFLLPSRHAKT